MTIVIPMAGRGQRFMEAGYKMPKMLIQAHGKTLLEWSVDSLPLAMCDTLIFVGLSEHDLSYRLEEQITRLYGDKPWRLRFIWIDAVTGGQAETVLCARSSISPEKPLLIFNVDTTFHSPTIASAISDPANDGVLGSFESLESRFSFAKVDRSGTVVQVSEKEPISSNALTGLYHFRRAADFLQAADEAILKNNRVKGEFYVAPLYNDLIALGRRFVIDPCTRHHILGTPAEFEVFAATPSDRISAHLSDNRGSSV